MKNHITIPNDIPIEPEVFDGALPFRNQKAELVHISHNSVSAKLWTLSVELIINGRQYAFLCETDNCILIQTWYDGNLRLNPDTLAEALEEVLSSNRTELMRTVNCQ